MTNDQFFQQFGHFIDAPNGIHKLRKLILQLAVGGKLVPQVPRDEPASVLLERIRVDKGNLVKDGIIRKQKTLPDIDKSELPFELPNSWEWIRVWDIAQMITSGSRDWAKYYSGSGSIFVTMGNLSRGSYQLRLDKIRYVNPPQDGEGSRTKLEENDLLISITGDVGNLGLIPADFGEAYINQHTCLLRFMSGCQNRFWPEYMRSPLATYQFNGPQRGIKNSFRLGDVGEMIAPMPPLAEQHRIVAKVDELMALCDQLEAERNTRDTTHQRLIRAVHHPLVEATDTAATQTVWRRIRDNFADLYTTLESVQALRQTILQLAVQGKLVPQDPNDESASQLIKNMSAKRDEWLEEYKGQNKECATMIRKLGKLDSPEAPYQLPTSWSCIHLIQASRMLVDCHNKTAPYVVSGIPIIRTSNIRNREFRMADIKYVNQETYDYWSRRCPPMPGDIIFTREAPMGEAAIIPKGAIYCLGQRTMLIRPMSDSISENYLLLALTEPHLLERASKHAIGSTVKHLRVGDVENLSVPIPPLAEQHRIVAKVNELMALCDQLEANIRDKNDTAIRYAEAIVQQIAAA